MEREGPVLTEQNREELRGRGYTVVTGVLSREECDDYVEQYRHWLKQFGEGGWPYSRHSLIQRYGVAHLEPSWGVRLKTKPVFQQLWGTGQLLSSLDAIAIGRPPEEGEEAWWEEGQHWLHCDQSAARKGCHAFQGAVYLEQADEDDWTLVVMEGSHLLHEQFYAAVVKPRLAASIGKKFKVLRDEDVTWFQERGCPVRRVAVPRGGMVLWDSRLIHANARPRQGRPHPRWRFVVFVCMAPAAWSNPRDLELKRHAYRHRLMTTHWPSDDVSFLDVKMPSDAVQDVSFPAELGELARSEEARRLAGVLPYEEPDPNATLKPEWVPDRIQDRDLWPEEKRPLVRLSLRQCGLPALFTLAAVFVGALWFQKP